MNARSSVRIAPFFLAALVACGEEGTSPASKTALGPSFNVGDVTNSTPEPGKIKICKTGNVNGTYAVSAPVTQGTSPNPSPTVASTPSVTSGVCNLVAEDNAPGDGSGSKFTISETSAGFVSLTTQLNNNPATPDAPDGGTYFVNSIHGWTLTYDNFVAPPPP